MMFTREPQQLVGADAFVKVLQKYVPQNSLVSLKHASAGDAVHHGLQARSNQPDSNQGLPAACILRAQNAPVYFVCINDVFSSLGNPKNNFEVFRRRGCKGQLLQQLKRRQ